MDNLSPLRRVITPQLSQVETNKSKPTSKFELKQFSSAHAGAAKEFITSCEDDFSKLNQYEKKALQPTLHIINEAVEGLNNIEFNESSVLTRASYVALKEVQTALSEQEIKLPAYCRSIKYIKTRASSYALAQNLQQITLALSEAVKTLLKDNDAEKILLIKNHGPQLSSMDIESMIANIERKEAGSNSQTRQNKKSVSEETENIYGLRLAFINARDAIINAENKAITNMNLKENLKKFQISDLTLAMDSLIDSSTKLQEYFNAPIPDDKQEEAFGVTKPQLASLKEVVDSKLEIIKQIKKNYEDYRSPKSIDNICQAKKIETAAAIRVLESQQTTEKNTSLISILKARLQNLDQPDKTSIKLDAVRLLGKKAITGIGRLLHPLDSARQAVRLEAMANRFIKNNKINGLEDLETVHFTEKMLMQRLLEKSGVKNAKSLLDEAISKELNTRPWTKIQSKFYVPAEVKGKISPIEVHSITTPAGEILTDPNRFKPVSEDSPFTQQSCEDYIIDPAKTSDPGKHVTGGFNSHDTTTAHAVSAAHSTCSVGGQVIFGGTRSGVNAAYDLTQEHLLDLPVEQSAAIIVSLIGEVEQARTEITIALPDENAVSTTTSGGLQTKVIQTINNLIQLAIKAEREKIKVDPRSLVDLVKQSKPLCDLLARQAALNRAREVFVLEMARDPNFMTKVAREETLLFSSISLLTPDPLRNTLHQKFGMSGSANEKAMLTTHLQAWRDLQEEINAGGIVINGKPVKATILTFNFGVNQGGVGLASNPIIGELVSGWSEVNGSTNNKAISNLLQHADSFLKEKQGELDKKLFQFKHLKLSALPAKIQKLSYDINVAQQLRDQIDTMWQNGSYQIAGNEPYKLPSRVAMLSFVLGGGTTFNCKSGKDRTGQLDVEAKFLGFQIHTNNGVVPKPDRVRSLIEKQQFNAFVFEDKSRAGVQQQNTGHAGSKLRFLPLLNLITAKKEFLGTSNYTKA